MGAMLLALPILACILTLPTANASFSATTQGGGNSFGTATLDPASSLTAVASGDDVDLGWTATPDLWAEGYNIHRGTAPGGPYSFHGSVTGAATTTHTDLDANIGGVPDFESVESTIQGPNSGFGVTTAVPSGTTDGDLLLAVISIDNSENSLPITAPGAWTELFQHGETGGGQSALGVWYRIASSEPADYTFTWPKAEEGLGTILRVSGADQTTPIDAWAIDGVTDNASPTAPDVTTTVDDTLVFRIVSLDGNDHVEPSPLSSIHPAGTTGRFELITDPSGSGGTIGAAAEHIQATAGPTGTSVFNIGAAEGWITATVALKPAAVATVYYYVLETYHGTWTSPLSNEASCC